MENQTKYKDWQQWGKDPDSESRYNVERVKGTLSEMESTKQLVKLISSVYEPGMRILDVGCNVGHYLTGIRKKFPNLDYTGVDAYDSYINKAKHAFENDLHAKFEVKDIFEPIYPNELFDIVYCCNVIQHLPDFRTPVTNLLNSTKKVCFIRTFLDDNTTIVKSPIADKYDNVGEPLDFYYLNTWNKDYFVDFIKKLGWRVELIDDEFNPGPIQKEFESTKINERDKGTRIIGNMQVVENIICSWKWVKITK